MKNIFCDVAPPAPTGTAARGRRGAMTLLIALLGGLVAPSVLQADATAKIFATPQAAVSELGRAVNATDHAALTELFGPRSGELENFDSVQGTQEMAAFTEAFNISNRLVLTSDTRMVLNVGTNGWPFPIPIVKVTNGWQFDAPAGIEELLNRRIGRNELGALGTIRAYVDAQREYANRDRDGDDVLEYAQRLASSPGQMDGLYWPPELNGEISPLGPLMADAQDEGYFKELHDPNAGPQPFHGYLFKILTRQGKHAPGGKYDYVINGNMIGGFAMVAWPADHGQTGIMTFIVNQQGRVYQKDLGPKTARLAPDIKQYDPDETWQLSPD